MITKEYEVTGFVRVTVDESKFTPEFMAEFRESFFPYETIEEHLEHLANLFARGVVDNSDTFIEGYGPPQEMGIRFAVARGGGAWIDNEIDLAEVQPAAEPA